MNYYQQSVTEVLDRVKSGENGLTSQQAAKRLEQNGKNKLVSPLKDGVLKKFFVQLLDPMVLILLAAAAISAVTAIIQHDSFTDLFIILFVVILNAIMGVVQENKAEKAIDALSAMTAAMSKVMRDGKIITVKSEDLVVGDVVVLAAGDAVPADCRIIEAYSLQVEEAALTGESASVTKTTEMLTGEKMVTLADRTNMLYSGSTVVYGRGKAVVTAAGMDTEMGKIAKALNESVNEQTPLQKKMAELSKVLTKLVIGICVFMIIFGIIINGFGSTVILNTFLMAVALAVAAIPEGLAAVVTVILSIGVTAMSKRQALVRRLTAVETLGCTQIICTDKTGTLTQNKMTVVDTVSDDCKLLAKAMALCSDAQIDLETEKAVGESTEAALVDYAYSLGLKKYELDEASPRVKEVPFDSERKMMSTLHYDGGRIIQYTKGACEILLDRCVGWYRDGAVVPMTQKAKNEIMAATKLFADRAMRVLGAAYRIYDEVPDEFDSVSAENDMIFIGFVGIIDPCRPEVYDAIKSCRQAGIRPIMITGDHRDTAVAIGRDLGIITDESQALTGAELEEISDEELARNIEKYSVYARVQPEHKTRIVKAWKANGKICAMTGDGVNDAPSIKEADIGIGMGITGTDVTKAAADIVLADDNFATIINAVEEGRKIYDNIRKVIQFLLSTNMAEVLTVFFSSVAGISILTPAHLLWINMVTDSVPALALGMEKAEGDLMRRKPRDSSEGLFSSGAGIEMALQGIYISAVVVFSFFLGQYMELGHMGLFKSADGMSMAFITMNFVEIFHALCMRSRHGSIFKMKTVNKWLAGAMALSFILTVCIMYIPFLASAFGITAINLGEFAAAFGLALSVIPVIEIMKAVMRRKYPEY